jgi:hypothetical protein
VCLFVCVNVLLWKAGLWLGGSLFACGWQAPKVNGQLWWEAPCPDLTADHLELIKAAIMSLYDQTQTEEAQGERAESDRGLCACAPCPCCLVAYDEAIHLARAEWHASCQDACYCCGVLISPMEEAHYFEVLLKPSCTEDKDEIQMRGP